MSDERDSSKKSSSNSESDNFNKCLNDVWAYDIHLKKWHEVRPEVKV